MQVYSCDALNFVLFSVTNYYLPAKSDENMEVWKKSLIFVLNTAI